MIVPIRKIPSLIFSRTFQHFAIQILFTSACTAQINNPVFLLSLPPHLNICITSQTLPNNNFKSPPAIKNSISFLLHIFALGREI